MVEAEGIEPPTSCLQSRRSTPELRPHYVESYIFLREYSQEEICYFVLNVFAAFFLSPSAITSTALSTVIFMASSFFGIDVNLFMCFT